MGTIILKIIVCSGIILGLYHLFLAKEKTFTSNRFYLLLGLIFSYTIPFVTIKINEIVKEKPTLITKQEIPMQVLPNPIPTQAETFDYMQLLLIIYFFISVVMIVKMLYSVIKIKTLVGRKIIYENRNVLILEKDIAPFSFLSTIYLSEKYFKDGKIDDSIFLHEEIHVKQKHSLDVLLIEIVKAFSWFNPFIYFYKNVMITNHEFIADEKVISQRENIKDYQQLILNEVLKQQNLQLTHQFNFNNTKKRFIMMTKKNSKFAKAKKYLAIPLFIVLAGIFAEKVSAKNASAQNPDRIENSFSEDPYIEFNKILKKYGNLLEQKKYGDFHNAVSSTDRARLQELYFKLTKEQRDDTPLLFGHSPKKFDKLNVTQSQINDFMNSKKYGLWIDGKKTKNQDLKNYKPEDFSHLFVSKRYEKVISTKNPQPYQVDMMTNAYFKNYLDEKEDIFMGFKEKMTSKGRDTITPRKNVNAKLTEVSSQNSDSEVKSAKTIAGAPEIDLKQEVTALPEYPGGVNAMRNKVSQNFNGAIFKGDENTVKTNIVFIINEKGEVSDVRANGNNEIFNKEAIRTVKLANENISWKPATKDGNNVAYRFQLPLTMKFESAKKTH